MMVPTRRGTARQGMAGPSAAWLGSAGKARPGEARHGVAGQAVIHPALGVGKP